MHMHRFKLAINIIGICVAVWLLWRAESTLGQIGGLLLVCAIVAETVFGFFWMRRKGNRKEKSEHLP